MALKLPPTYILKTRFTTDQAELHRLEREIDPVMSIHEAKIVLGRISQKERAQHELRVLGLDTDEFVKRVSVRPKRVARSQSPARKKRKVGKIGAGGREVILIDSSGESDGSVEDDDEIQIGSKRTSSQTWPRATGRATAGNTLDGSQTGSGSEVEDSEDETIKVLNLNWYSDSLKAGKLLPMKPPYLIYEGKNRSTTRVSTAKIPPVLAHTRPRAKTPPITSSTSPTSFRKTRSPQSHTKTRPSQLIHEDTMDHDAGEDIPPLPEYLRSRWSCQRPTPMHSPNDAFIAQLKIIRRARDLEANEVAGHDFSSKSYSGAIASIAAYPHTLTSVKEVLRLPGCGPKIGLIWQEWREAGEIQEVKEIESDERLKCLSIFSGIHQVGEAKAREFYNKGWRDLDDVIEYGWSTLTRDQQIGLKYYDELAQRIPRAEVESTGNTILTYAHRIDPGIKMCIVGGYRRGKPDSGDMDFILSHPSESVTSGLLGQLLDALGTDHGAGWITHELTVSTKNSERGQQTLPWRGSTKKSGRRSGFDTLDHAFVVWQDPSWDGAENRGAGRGKNPNVHRRVDIIISPWKTAGCAVLGWSGGTHFERDLRSYSREAKGWKFDSSGVRVVGTGAWVDLERREGDVDKDLTLEEKEKRVFEGLGLIYRKPTERCTH